MIPSQYKVYATGWERVRNTLRDSLCTVACKKCGNKPCRQKWHAIIEGEELAEIAEE